MIFIDTAESFLIFMFENIPNCVLIQLYIERHFCYPKCIFFFQGEKYWDACIYILYYLKPRVLYYYAKYQSLQTDTFSDSLGKVAEKKV